MRGCSAIPEIEKSKSQVKLVTHDEPPIVRDRSSSYWLCVVQ
jgi:hypothetical protein